jgi:hypothetical protein
MSTPAGSVADSVQAFNEAERNAMRGYLQRCEVRLSTLHRIGTAFISGAGLLLLIPVFLKDAIDQMITILLAQTVNQFPVFGTNGLFLTIVLILLLLYPLLLSMCIPLYGVYLLLKDIVHFYFTIYTPGFSADLLNPTFALTGIMFSVDESPRVKREVMRYQYEATQMGFMIPFSKGRSELYFDSIIKKSNGEIVPQSRRMTYLETLDVLPEDCDRASVERFNAALGLARALDRSLVQEVAVTEMALVRHVLYLRRLMFRYVKTLLMFIWTTLVLFIMLPILNDPRFPTLMMLALGYLAWAVGVVPVIQLPRYWIYRHRNGDAHRDHLDPQLLMMETNLRRYCYMAVVASALALMLAVTASLL